MNQTVSPATSTAPHPLCWRCCLPIGGEVMWSGVATYHSWCAPRNNPMFPPQPLPPFPPQYPTQKFEPLPGQTVVASTLTESDVRRIVREELARGKEQGNGK